MRDSRMLEMHSRHICMLKMNSLAAENSALKLGFHGGTGRSGQYLEDQRNVENQD